MKLYFLILLLAISIPSFACHSAIDHGYLVQKSDLVIMGEVTKSVKPAGGGIGFAEIKVENVYYTRWGMEGTSIVVPTAYTGMSTNDAYQHKKGEKGIWILEYVNDIYVLRNISSKTLTTDRDFEKVKSMMVNFKGVKGGLQMKQLEMADHELEDVDLKKKNKEDVLIEEGGDYVWNDGASIFRMNSDHTFVMGPKGWSGATARGIWKHNGEGYIIIGKWSWMNGLSKLDDYRILELDVRVDYNSRDDEGYYKPYWRIESLQPSCKAKFGKWKEHFKVKLDEMKIPVLKPSE